MPGVIVNQRNGKASQHFLRGLNLDHGADFTTFADGMPVTMSTHAHGRGCGNLN